MRLDPSTTGRLYHMVDAHNWASVERQGLLSATALIREAHPGQDGETLRRTHRAESLDLCTGKRLRDQAPMPPSALSACLDDDLTPADWYGLLNDRVFFWADAVRLNRHRRACIARDQIVLILDATSLLDMYAPTAEVTPINTGYALRRPAARGRRSFVSLPDWRHTRWDAEAAHGRPARPACHAAVEVAIPGAVEDLWTHVFEVVHLAENRLMPVRL